MRCGDCFEEGWPHCGCPSGDEALKIIDNDENPQGAQWTTKEEEA